MAQQASGLNRTARARSVQCETWYGGHDSGCSRRGRTRQEDERVRLRVSRTARRARGGSPTDLVVALTRNVRHRGGVSASPEQRVAVLLHLV
jgi:hypothetical protein